MNALYDILDSSLLPCQLEGPPGSSQFLPASEWRKIKKDDVNAALSFKTRLFSPAIAQKAAREAKRVFTILVLIQEPAAIEHLVREGITDEDLPLCRNGDNNDRDKDYGEYNVLASVGGNKRFPSSRSWPQSKVRHFLELQWAVQCPIFDKLGGHFVLDAECPFPLIECQTKQAEGGMGTVHKAKLHPDHQQLFQEGEQPFVAIKEIPKKDVFSKEKDNLDVIQAMQNKHLITLLASCERGSKYYLFFPWADGGTLKDFWEEQDSRPRTPGLIRWALEQILGLVDAIRALHGDNIRHGDIKPLNVLVFKEADNAETLVLADVGISRLHKEATHLRESRTTTADVTVSYEAPEADDDRQRNKPRPRRYDMWSAGCMFLEFTVWLVYNHTAVESFKKKRAASKDPRSPCNFFAREPTSIEIHPTVAEAMQHLREHPLCKDGTALSALLTLIEDRLLRIQPEDRAKAPELYDTVKAIVDTAAVSPEGLGSEATEALPIPEFFNT